MVDLGWSVFGAELASVKRGGDAERKGKVKKCDLTCGSVFWERLLVICCSTFPINPKNNIGDPQYHYIGDGILGNCWRYF
jgi:hypothetical protein